MKYKELTTEYLIINEETIDWDELSKESSRSFSLAEIRMFRKRIIWSEYIKNHNMSLIQLNIASKYFDVGVYRMIALLNAAPEEFIISHMDNFLWLTILATCKLSCETIFKCKECWEIYPREKIAIALKSNKQIDLSDESYKSLVLYLNLTL